MHPKPPPHMIDVVRRKLRDGDELTVADRIVALWFINASEGWPEVNDEDLEWGR